MKDAIRAGFGTMERFMADVLGKSGVPAEEAAQAIVEAVGDFRTNHLKKVALVALDDALCEAFRRSAKTFIPLPNE